MRDWLIFAIGFLVGQLALIIYLYLDAYLQHLEAQETAEPEPQPEHHIDNVTVIHGIKVATSAYPYEYEEWDEEEASFWEVVDVLWDDEDVIIRPDDPMGHNDWTYE
jgi:hypothetical protein